MDEPFNDLGHEVPLLDDEAVTQLAKLSNPMYDDSVAVEVGSWVGHTTRLLAEIHYEVFAVDHFCGCPYDHLGELARQAGGREVVYRTFRQNMGARLFRSVFPLRMTSKEAAATWPKDLPIDFLYIDADHRYEAVQEDIALWSPLVRQGGIIAGHDFGIFDGVTRAVQESGPFERAGVSVWWRRKP